MDLHRVETGNPDRLEYANSSGGPGFLFGLMIAGVGWFILKNPIDDISRQASDAIAYGAFALGAMAATLRCAVYIDREAGTLVTAWGFLFPFFRRTRPLDVQEVRLSREEFRRKGCSYISYHIAVDIAGKRISLGAHNDNIKAWALAQELAAFLDVELQDESGFDGAQALVG